ncbi:MAG: TetR family transcriptional regulator [Nocardioidaceae bacterium]
MLNNSEDARGRGRPRGSPDTKGAIVTAAKARFSTDGYAATSLRSIARDAGVDPALLNYHFGSKQGLFAAVMALEFSPSAVLEEVLAGAGRAGGPPTAAVLLGAFVDAWDDENRRASIVVLLREAVANDETRRLLREYIEREILGRVAAHLGGRDARQRAAPVATIMAGLVFARYVIAIEPLASMSRAEVIRFIGPTLSHALREPVAPRRQPRSRA